MQITFERSRLNPTSTKTIALEASYAEINIPELEQNLSCDIATFIPKLYWWQEESYRILTRVNIKFEISGNFLSIKTSCFVFPQAPIPYLVGVVPGTYEGLKDNKLDLNNFLYRAGDLQEP